MISYTKSDIRTALERVGLRPGQVLYLQADLTMPGRLEGCKTREAFCGAYLESIVDLIGSDGTLVVPTYTTHVARFDLEFVLEETPSLMGVFSEFVRQQPGSVRSPHPLGSLTAIGARKEEICRDVGHSNYGYDSPFQRLLEHRAKIVTIGLDSGYAVGLAHFVECVCGVPYVYNKLLKWKPIIQGRQDPHDYYASVRHLQLNVVHDLRRWLNRVKEVNGLFTAPLGASKVHLTDYKMVFDEGVKLLREDPYTFLEQHPGFTYGQVPYDGPTSADDRIAAKEDADKLKSINWVGYYTLDRPGAGGD